MPSRRKRDRPPEPRLTFFVDRSLGAVFLPEALRAIEWDIVVMQEVYGRQLCQDLDDPPWIEEVTEKGQVILTKDTNFKYKTLEREAVERSGAKVFCLANQSLQSDAQIQHFVVNKNRILRAARKPGPFIYMVYEKNINTYWP